MTSLPYAYSIELDDIIDAELAYELFWAGKIRDKSAFSCPEEGCKGNAIGINLHKVVNDWVQAPHFRGFNHDEHCIYHEKNIRTNAKGKSNRTGTRSELDEFLLARPDKEKGTMSSNKVEGTTRAKRTKGPESDIVYHAKYFTIRSLVSNFATHRKEGEEMDRFVRIDGLKLSYKDLFIGVYNQDSDNLPKDNRIYWGVAFLDRGASNNHYRVTFAEAFKLKGEVTRPSFLLYDNLIDSYHSRLIGRRIKQYAKEKSPRVLVFIYGKPAEEKKYLNFKVDNLDMLDIRGLDFFNELKKE